jgi:type IV secretion system protein VirB1
VSAAAVALSTLLQQCAPNVGERTMTAIVRVESNAYPLAIYDNTTRRSFAPRTIHDAMSTARALLDAGHSVDLGLAQVNASNLPRLGINVRDAFDPCTNLRGAATILETDYEAAANRFSPGPYALRRAIGAYNSGSIYAGDDYVDRILIAAGLPPQGDRRIPDLEPPAPALPGPAIPLTGLAPNALPFASQAAPAAPPAAHAAAAQPKPPPPPNPYGSAIMVMSAKPMVPETLLQPQQPPEPQPTASSDAAK